jgi:hypothetical protein
MKATIGAKIRAVMEKYPEVKRRRAQLNAIGYLFKRDQNVRVQWSHHENSVSAVTSLNAAVSMKFLSEYKYEPPMEIPNGGKGVLEPLGADVKLVFKGGKFEVKP